MQNKGIILLNDAFKNNNQITRTRAIELIGHCYYHNGPKYVSEVLARLVNSGKLTRVGRGNYEVSKQQIKRKESSPVADTNQIKLL